MSNQKPTLLALFALESLSSLILSSPIIRLPDLASLSLVSKNFRVTTTPFLYSRVILYSPNAIRKFLFSILQRPTTYATFVHTMYLGSHRVSSGAFLLRYSRPMRRLCLRCEIVV
ncbi:hypothetical protein J3R30DRAFT_113459 [Lentinula aciculospora]|uniref:F-box domain-containing protein n=1 Tax=Lentinula aciculospora TaxID=153920 RepID=A0A9W9AWR2_9AGAR|nr:hypothetical protein J3R30DRAFT_113459 [Lentinula aciculospora]